MYSSTTLFFFLLTITLPLLATSNGGFSTDLIHRDSPNSPLFNPNLTSFDRLLESINRSIVRYNNLNTQAMDSTITPAGGEYLMSLNIGTPSLKVLAIADTGSDLTWTQCKPCTRCYKQTAPIFDSSKSSTYAPLPCRSRTCSQLPRGSCDRTSKCSYLYQYGDGSRTVGVLSTETISIGSSSMPKLLFGCSHYSAGTFDASSAGIVGLGGGPLSLISQLGTTIGYKFSYCLVPYGSRATSKINFGDNAVVGPNALITPLVRGRINTYYTVRLESISVANGKKIAVVNKDNYGGGNIIVDSGTTLTILDDGVLSSVVRDVRKLVRYRTTRDTQNLFSLCYDLSGEDMNRLVFPDITFHFTGAAVTLKRLNAFIRTQQTVWCLALASSSKLGGGIQIFGNIAQQNFHVGYDLKRRRLSFAPADCSKM